MSMKRKCYFCGKPVDIRRQMSLFCSSRCEALESSLPGAGQGSHPAQPPAASSMPASARTPLTGK
ncbi:MAG: hypothetical protein V3S64_01780 [bacterium]